MPLYANPEQIQDPDSVKCPLFGIAVDDYPTHHGEHSHKKGQLLYCSQGVVHFFCQGHYFLLPPSKAAWIPAGWLHDIRSSTTVCYRSLYVDEQVFSGLPKSMQVIAVMPLLKLLIDKACSFEIDYDIDGSEFHVAQVIIDEIRSAKTMPFHVPKPKDKRLNQLFNRLLKNPGSRESVDSLANSVHITSRTLTRLCQKELGMSFEKWRLQIKLLHAFSLLGEGNSVTQVSQSLGYSNDSTFIARFKEWTGETPAAYRRKI